VPLSGSDERTSVILKQSDKAKPAAVSGSGAFCMQAVARQLASGKNDWSSSMADATSAER